MKAEQTLKNILVLTDGSVPSHIAQELTAFLAKRLGSKVTVTHVVSHELMNPEIHRFFADSEYPPAGVVGATTLPPEVHVPKPQTSSSEETVRQITEAYHKKGEEAISDAVTFFKEEGIIVNPKLIQDADPAETILKEAKEGNYDLIVMGSAEEQEKEPHLGSVAKKILHHAQTPVLISRKKKNISKILVPVDGSENAAKAIQYSDLLARKTGASITLLYVQEHGLSKLKPELSKRIGNRILSMAAKQVEGTTPDQKLEVGDPAKMIIQTADKGNYDMIIIGSKGHGAVSRFLLGSVSDHVAHYAKHPVLITK